MRQWITLLVGLVGITLFSFYLVPYLQDQHRTEELVPPPAPALTCEERALERAKTARFRVSWGTPSRQVAWNSGGGSTWVFGSSTTDSLTLQMDVAAVNDFRSRKFTGNPWDADTVFAVAGLSPAGLETAVTSAKHDLYCRWLEEQQAACRRQAARDSLNAIVRQYDGPYQPAPDECAEPPEVCR